MNRNELITSMCTNADLTELSANKVISSLTSIISSEVKAGRSITILDIGTFKPRANAARIYWHPRFGGYMQGQPSFTIGFRQSKTLKEIVN